jgi:ribonucleoside-diphosphate reductase alpha chain
VFDFSKLKDSFYKPIDWRLSLNVRMETEFLYRLDAEPLLLKLCESIRRTGDPGFLFWDRFNARNPNPKLRPRVAVAPCAEVALSAHEGCVFGYLNVGKFMANGTLDLEEFERAISDVVSLLDICIDVLSSKGSHFDLVSARRVGVGICGFADLLHHLSYEYASAECLDIAVKIASALQFFSKRASMQLASVLGANSAFRLLDCTYRSEASPILSFANASHPCISGEDWRHLHCDVQHFGLRHQTTVVFPPSGKSSILINASPGIEPFDHSLSEERQVCISRSALSVPWQSQIDVAGAFSTFSDDSVSKTITFPEHTSARTILSAVRYAADRGLCGVTGYVYGSR